MPLSPRLRKRYIEIYGTEPAHQKQVYEMILEALNNKTPLSLIRAGDIVTLTLSDKSRFIRPEVFDFLGISYPPPAELVDKLHHAIVEATILGVTTFKGRTGIAEQLKAYLDENCEAEPLLTHSFINDDLYDDGFLNKLINNYRVVFIGRAAPLAAARYGCEGFVLDHWTNVDEVKEKLPSEWDLALVGAGIPGRILCNELRRQGKVAIEIGHIMDALAYPNVWAMSDKAYRRQAFKNAQLEEREPRPMIRATAVIPGEIKKYIIIYPGTAVLDKDTHFATNSRKNNRFRKKLKRLFGIDFIPYTLDIDLNQELNIENATKSRYGSACPAKLSGTKVFIYQNNNLSPKTVRVLSEENLIEKLNLKHGDRVSLEVDGINLE